MSPPVSYYQVLKHEILCVHIFVAAVAAAAAAAAVANDDYFSPDACIHLPVFIFIDTSADTY